jgi:hypothetical protein
LWIALGFKIIDLNIPIPFEMQHYKVADWCMMEVIGIGHYLIMCFHVPY